MPPTEVALSITTQSQQMATFQGPVNPPKITLDGNPLPQPTGGNPDFASGFQVVVLDPALDLTQPASIRSNVYHPLPNDNGNWGLVYQYMYADVATQILTSGDINQQIVFVVSFGMDANAAPTTDALPLLLELGAGPALQRWETSVDRGSESGDWVGFPANYVLVGASQYGYGDGTEKFDYPGSSPVTTTVEATLTNFG